MDSQENSFPFMDGHPQGALYHETFGESPSQVYDQFGGLDDFMASSIMQDMDQPNPHIRTYPHALYDQGNTTKYACGCGKEYKHKNNLCRHRSEKGCDGRPKREYTCDQCSKKFPRSDRLKAHVKADHPSQGN